MAVKGKKTKKFKFKFKIDILKSRDVDLQKDNVAWLKKEASKHISPLEFEVDAELDERKWNEKKLEEEAYYSFRMAIKVFDVVVTKARKDNDAAAIKSAFKTLEKDADYGFEKWLKDIESGKEDNAKSLADGKKAMNKLTAVDFRNAFDEPRTQALDELQPLLKAQPDPKQGPKVSKALASIQSSFESVGKEAQKAVDFLMKSARKSVKDDSVDAKLNEFWGEVMKGADVFDPFLDGCDKLTDALDDAIAATKTDKIDMDELKKAAKTLNELSSLNKKADKAVKLATDLLPKFKSIESKLK